MTEGGRQGVRPALDRERVALEGQATEVEDRDGTIRVR